MGAYTLGSHSTIGRNVQEKLRDLAWKHCVPLTTTFEITLGCNLRCVHCYNFDRAEPVPKSRAERYLTSEEITQTVDQLADAGCLYLYFTGGEALLHPDLESFVRCARKRFMRVGLKTNGMLITPSLARDLLAWGVESFEVSLYGTTSVIHDGFTGVAGSFDRTLAGIRALCAAKGPLRLSFCLTRHNVHQAAEMLAMGASMGAGVSVDPQLTARYDGASDAPLDHRVSRDALREVYAGPLRSLLPAPDRRPERGIQCSCARTVCGIASNGDVYPCMGAPMVAGNLRELPFETIWQKSPQLQRIRGLEIEDFPTCEPCPHRAYCRRSSGTVFVNTGDYCGAEPWTCMEAEVLHELVGL